MNKSINYSWDNTHKGVNNIAMQMYKDNWRPDYIVGITRGGLVPAVLLSHLTDIPMHTLCVQLGAEGLEENLESNKLMAKDAIEGKNILVIDDINRGGDALEWIINDWSKSSEIGWEDVWHGNVRFASLVMDPNSKIDTDYYYEELDTESEIWVNFPWEQ